MTMRERALQAYEQSELDRLARIAEQRRQDCRSASFRAERVFGAEPESSVWSRELGCPLVSYDGGRVELAWPWRDGENRFHVVFRCEDCGGPLMIWPEVHDLAELGSRLNEGLTCECYEGHRCSETKRLVDYMTAEAAT